MDSFMEMKEGKLWEDHITTELSALIPKLHLVGGHDNIFESGPYPSPFEFNEDVATVFDDMVTRSVPMYREVIDGLIYWTKRFYQKGSVIFDLGCSTGTTIDILAQTLQPGANFVGIDISRPMVKRANAKLSWAFEKHSIQLLQEDVNMSDISNASVVIMNYTLQFIPLEERLRLMQRIYRGLRPGGILVISEKVRSAIPLVQSTTTHIYEDFKSRAGYSRIEIAKKKDALQNVLIPMTEHQLQSMLAVAGFESSELVQKQHNFSTFVALKATAPAESGSGGISKEDPILATSVEKVTGNTMPPTPAISPTTSALDSFFDPDPDYLYTLLRHDAVQTLNAARLAFFREKRPRFDELEAVAALLRSLPQFSSRRLVVNQPALEIGDGDAAAGELSEEQLRVFDACLRGLMPWKKGPLMLFGREIDAEWRSDYKWERIVPHIASLKNKVVADVGCANGYFMFRMLEHGPKLVMGLDPNIKAWMEFQLLKYFSGRRELQFEVLTGDHLDLLLGCFDTIFCLGVLYHCTDPIGMLRKLHASLKPGGELIVDCQGIAEESPQTPVALFPRKAYAGAKGIWFLPSRTCLENWLARTQFHDVRCFYDEPLSSEEQRATEWAPISSLAQALDSSDASKTVEGYPAPRRIYMTAKRR